MDLDESPLYVSTNGAVMVIIVTQTSLKDLVIRIKCRNARMSASSRAFLSTKMTGREALR